MHQVGRLEIEVELAALARSEPAMARRPNAGDAADFPLSQAEVRQSPSAHFLRCGDTLAANGSADGSLPKHWGPVGNFGSARVQGLGDACWVTCATR